MTKVPGRHEEVFCVTGKKFQELQIQRLRSPALCSYIPKYVLSSFWASKLELRVLKFALLKVIKAISFSSSKHFANNYILFYPPGPGYSLLKVSYFRNDFLLSSNSFKKLFVRLLVESVEKTLRLCLTFSCSVLKIGSLKTLTYILTYLLTWYLKNFDFKYLYTSGQNFFCLINIFT